MSTYHENFFRFLLEKVIEHKVDVVLVSGDFFDTAVPARKYLKLTSKALTKLCEHTKVIITSGNHDDSTRLGFLSEFLNENLIIKCDVTSAHIPITFTSDNTRVNIFALPYLNPVVTRNLLYEPSVEQEDNYTQNHSFQIKSADTLDQPYLLPPATHELAMQLVVDNMKNYIDENSGDFDSAHTIVMAHEFFTTGASDEEVAGGLGNISLDCFEKIAEHIDYVAAGHLHTAHNIDSKYDFTVRYSGSVLPFSFKEKSDGKSLTLIEIDDEFKYTTIDIPEFFPTARIADSLENLLTDKYETCKSKFLELTITDSVPNYDRIPELYLKYDNILSIVTCLTQADHNYDFSKNEEKSDYDILINFFEDFNNLEISQAQKHLLQELINTSRQGGL